MSDANATLSLPNADTPLAFLPPTLAFETSTAVYVLAASVGVLVWDVLDNIPDEFTLLFKRKITLSTIAYFGSRIGSLGYTIGSAVFQIRTLAAPLGHCEAGETIPDVFYPISLSCSALLFFIRVRAVYNNSRCVTVAFFILWLGVVGCTSLIPITVRGAHVGETAYCQDASVPRFAYVALLAPLVYDTLVFFAMLWCTAHHAHVELDNLRDGFRVVVLKRYLPAFTKYVMIDNQKYYFVVLVSNIVTVVLAFDSSIPTPMRSMASAPNIVLTNVMACRIYRNIKCGSLDILSGLTHASGRRPISPVAFGQMSPASSDQTENENIEMTTLNTPSSPPLSKRRDIESGLDITES